MAGMAGIMDGITDGMAGITDGAARKEVMEVMAARKEDGIPSLLLLFLLLARVSVLLPREVIVANGTQCALALEARRADMEDI